MDERLQYEQLIGGKLQSLPVPDMQDAIWARVKAQLDIDLPTDDGDGGSSPQSPSGPGIIGWGLSVVIIALITGFFIFKNKPKTKDTTNPATTTEQIISPSVQNNGPPLPRDNTIKGTTVPVQTNQNTPVPGVMRDSVAQQNLTAVDPVSRDSVQNSVQNNFPPPLATVPVPKPDTSLQVKKGKGMKGLNDSDYRIVPKKN